MITNLLNLPAGFNPNYLLCISWYDSDNNMHRYALWKDVGELIDFPLPIYAGQKIGKNFRFEVWSCNNVTASQATPLTFYTSVLGKQDYRWGTDFVLVNPDPENTSFSYAAGAAGIIASFAQLTNGFFPLNGTYQGRNTYKVINIIIGGLPYTFNVYWNSGWFIDNGFNIPGANLYHSPSDVATPDLAMNWVLGPFGVNPLPTILNNQVFTLPLTFPSTAVSQPNI